MMDVRKMPSFVPAFVAASTRALAHIHRVLTFSLADDLIAPQKNLSVSIARGSITAAYGSRFFSNIRIRGIKEYSFDEDRYPQPEELLSALSLAVSEFDTDLRDLTLIIPKAWTVIRTVEFPSTVRENLSDVVSFELDRLTPFTAEDAFFDYKLLNDKGDRISLVLMASKADQILPYITALGEAGFTVGRISVNLSAMGSLFRHAYRGTDTLYLEMDKMGYEGAFFRQGTPEGVFSGNTEGVDARTKTQMISGCIGSMLSTEMKKSSPQQTVVFLNEKNPELKELIKTGLGLPVRFLGETDTGLRLPPPHKDVRWTAVGGIIESLTSEVNGTDLLKKGRPYKQKTPLGLTLLLLIVLSVTVFFYLLAPLKVEQGRIGEISRQINSRKEEVKKVEALKKEAGAIASEIASIDNFKQERLMTLTILKELTTVLPKTTWTSRVRVTATTVELEGFAGTATELLPRLETSKYFRKVEFASPTYRDPRFSADRFRIKMELEGIKESVPQAQDRKNPKDTTGEKIKNEKT